LTAGNHKLELRKDTYKSQILELNINETFNEKVRAVLSRTVRFSALDNLGTNGTDIGASVISIKHNDNEYLRNSRYTPFELDLPAFTYTAIFAKSGYQRASQIVRPDTRALVVKMEQLQSIIELTVMDALTELPIPGVEIFYNSADKPNELSSYLDQTDLKGVSIRQLNSGNYIFTLKKFGYSDLSRPVVIRSAETFKFTFEMFPTN